MSLGEQVPPPPHVGKINYHRDLTPELAIIRVQPGNGSAVPDFKAGQFVALGLKLDSHYNITYRPYSISSPPEEKRYFEFYIKSASEYVMSRFTNTLFKMFEGDLVYWRNPAGAFTIEDKKADGTPDTRRLVLLHGAKYAQELGYYDMLKSLSASNPNFKYLTTVSRPDHDLSYEWRGNVGRVETLLVGKDGYKSQLEKAVGEEITPENSFFHVCGYAGTINAVISILSPLGFVSNRKKREDGSFDIKIETYI
jgi:ferredoxin--NADP+ reductase